MGPCLSLQEHHSCLSHRKTHWTMSTDNEGLTICLLKTSNFMDTMTFFPWCKPKQSRDEFNNQSHILQGLGTTSWCMMWTAPKYQAIWEFDMWLASCWMILWEFIPLYLSSNDSVQLQPLIADGVLSACFTSSNEHREPALRYRWTVEFEK